MPPMERIELVPPPEFCEEQGARRDSPFGPSQVPVVSVNLGNLSWFLLCEAKAREEVDENEGDKYRNAVRKLRECYKAFQEAYPWYPLPITHFLEKIVRAWTSEDLYWDILDLHVLDDYHQNRRRYREHYNLSTFGFDDGPSLSFKPGRVLDITKIGNIVGSVSRLLYQSGLVEPLGGVAQGTDFRRVTAKKEAINQKKTKRVNKESHPPFKENWRHPGCPMCPELLDNKVWDANYIRSLNHELWRDSENSRLHDLVWRHAVDILFSYRQPPIRHVKRCTLLDKIYDNLSEMKKAVAFHKSNGCFDSIPHGLQSDEISDIHKMEQMLQTDFQDHFQSYTKIRHHHEETKENMLVPFGRYINDFPHERPSNIKHHDWRKFKKIEERYRQVEILIEAADENVRNNFMSPSIEGKIDFGWRRIHKGLKMENMSAKHVQAIRAWHQERLMEKEAADSNITYGKIAIRYRNKFLGLDDKYFSGLHQAHAIRKKHDCSVKANFLGLQPAHLNELAERFGDPKTMLKEIERSKEGIQNLIDSQWYQKGEQLRLKKLVEIDTAMESNIGSMSYLDQWRPGLLREYQAAINLLDYVAEIIKQHVPLGYDAKEKVLFPPVFGEGHWYNQLEEWDTMLAEEDLPILKLAAEISHYEAEESPYKPVLQGLENSFETIGQFTRVTEKVQNSAQEFTTKIAEEALKKGKGAVKDSPSLEKKRQAYIVASFKLLESLQFLNNEAAKRRTASCDKQIDSLSREVDFLNLDSLEGSEDSNKGDREDRKGSDSTASSHTIFDDDQTISEDSQPNPAGAVRYEDMSDAELLVELARHTTSMEELRAEAELSDLDIIAELDNHSASVAVARGLVEMSTHAGGTGSESSYAHVEDVRTGEDLFNV